MSSDRKPVGLTADAGFQTGVSRTVDHSLDAVLGLLTSEVGTAIWLGPGARLWSVRGH